MKKRPVCLALLALSLRLAAQLPDGVVAPDFNAPDINGQYWHLYDILADDKIVVLEISATWCPPCWSYHNGHALQNLYAEHGPEGDDRLRVFFVEGDPNTNVDCLYGPSGCNDYSPGDWVEGTDFPILDHAGIADDYQVGYYPTLFVICPNKKAYEVHQLNADDLWEKAQACPVASGANNAGIYDYQTGTDYREICTSLEVAPSFALVNLGSNLLTNASVDLRWNGDLVQTLQWSGGLPLYGEATLEFDALPLDDAGMLTTTLTQVNAAPADEDTTNNTRVHEFVLAPQFAETQILLKIRTDQYGAETYWELRNEAGAVLDFGGNQAVGPYGGGQFPGSIPGGPGAYGNSTTINEILNLPGPGCYTLHFVDAYGDGMCCGYGNGYYKLYNYGSPGLLVAQGGHFEDYDRRAFALGQPSVGTTTAAADFDVSIFPNPAGEFCTVEWNLPEDGAVFSGLIVNALGQTMQAFSEKKLPPGPQQWHIETHNWPAGFYALKFQTGSHSAMRTFVKQ